VFEEINWRWCRHNRERCHISGVYTVSDGVTPSQKRGPKPLNPPLTMTPC